MVSRCRRRCCGQHKIDWHCCLMWHIVVTTAKDCKSKYKKDEPRCNSEEEKPVKESSVVPQPKHEGCKEHNQNEAKQQCKDREISPWVHGTVSFVFQSSRHCLKGVVCNFVSVRTGEHLQLGRIRRPGDFAHDSLKLFFPARRLYGSHTRSGTGLRYRNACPNRFLIFSSWMDATTLFHSVLYLLRLDVLWLNEQVAECGDILRWCGTVGEVTRRTVAVIYPAW
jgi:hypothetical protein